MDEFEELITDALNKIYNLDLMKIGSDLDDNPKHLAIAYAMFQFLADIEKSDQWFDFLEECLSEVIINSINVDETSH